VTTFLEPVEGLVNELIDKTLKHVFIGFFVALIAVIVTWSIAFFIIANHCEKLGRFYVSEKVFECQLKE
jgi:uncharacterized PurR-regulated membrane protein YhhQ (DUF165 family)